MFQTCLLYNPLYPTPTLPAAWLLQTLNEEALISPLRLACYIQTSFVMQQGTSSHVVLQPSQAPASQDASQGLALWGVRPGGRVVDTKAVGDALWSLVLGYLDARLPGELCPASAAPEGFQPILTCICHLG